MDTQIYFTPPKTYPRDRRSQIQSKLEEIFKTFDNFIGKPVENGFRAAPETDEQRLQKIKDEILNLEMEVEKQKSYAKNSIPYKKVENLCVKLQIRLDNLQVEDMEEMRQERKKALAKIEEIKNMLLSKIKK